MVDMKNATIIHVLDDCNSAVALAINDFEDGWLRYSAASSRYPIAELIKELIDPAVNHYCAGLSQRQVQFVAGVAGGASFGAIVQLIGLDATARVQQELLRTFMRFAELEPSRGDPCFVATIESLIYLAECCSCKQSPQPRLRSTGLMGAHRPGHCRFCGTMDQLTACIQKDPDFLADDETDEFGPSAWYCSVHRPKLSNGAWNPRYRQAMRSRDQFDLELRRLKLQCAHPARPNAESGDDLVDDYIWHYVSDKNLSDSLETSELRDHARLMVDAKLSDHKKQMLTLVRRGLNQSKIAQELRVERQAVSKALKKTPAVFRLDNVPRKLYVVGASEAQVSA